MQETRVRSALDVSRRPVTPPSFAAIPCPRHKAGACERNRRRRRDGRTCICTFGRRRTGAHAHAHSKRHATQIQRSARAKCMRANLRLFCTAPCHFDRRFVCGRRGSLHAPRLLAPLPHSATANLNDPSSTPSKLRQVRWQLSCSGCERCSTACLRSLECSIFRGWRTPAQSSIRTCSRLSTSWQIWLD